METVQFKLIKDAYLIQTQVFSVHLSLFIQTWKTTYLLPIYLPTYLLNYLLTYLLHGAGPSWVANRFAASQEIPRILWNPKVH